MSPEDITPSEDDRDEGLLWKYPQFKGKVGCRVTVDWTGVKDPGPEGKEFKLRKIVSNREGQHEAEIYGVVNGEPKTWRVPVKNVENNEGF